MARSMRYNSNYSIFKNDELQFNHFIQKIQLKTRALRAMHLALRMDSGNDEI